MIPLERCEFCGYRLEGIDGKKRCPECGKKIRWLIPWAEQRKPIEVSFWLGFTALVSPLVTACLPFGVLFTLILALSAIVIGWKGHRLVRRGVLSQAEYWPSLHGMMLGALALLVWPLVAGVFLMMAMSP